MNSDVFYLRATEDMSEIEILKQKNEAKKLGYRQIVIFRESKQNDITDGLKELILNHA